MECVKVHVAVPPKLGNILGGTAQRPRCGTCNLSCSERVKRNVTLVGK